MPEEVGIVMKLYDQVSPSLKSIAGNTKAFDKDMDDLEASLKAYDKAQTVLTDRLASLKKEMAENSLKVKEAQKAYKSLKDETSKGALDDAIEEQVRLRREMAETTAVINSNAAAYKNLYREASTAASTESRLSNRAVAAASSPPWARPDSWTWPEMPQGSGWTPSSAPPSAGRPARSSPAA